jgi:hypothetical protein
MSSHFPYGKTQNCRTPTGSLVKEYCQKNGMITEQQESILEGINRGKSDG